MGLPRKGKNRELSEQQQMGVPKKGKNKGLLPVEQQQMGVP